MWNEIPEEKFDLSEIGHMSGTGLHSKLWRCTQNYYCRMKITVLGSSGQIGAYLTEYLRRKGHTVHEFDVVNGRHHDATVIPNAELHRVIYDTDFVFFLHLMLGGHVT